jgi:hypothetical protein
MLLVTCITTSTINILLYELNIFINNFSYVYICSIYETHTIIVYIVVVNMTTKMIYCHIVLEKTGTHISTDVKDTACSLYIM